MSQWGPRPDAPFGGKARQMFDIVPKDADHPLAPKMMKLYSSIEHDMKMDNRNVRKRNAKTVEGLMEGVRAGCEVHVYNMAELFYNGAPGVNKDWNRTLHLYVAVMESASAAEKASNAQFVQMLFLNLIGVVESMELEGMAPVAERLDAACSLPCWRDLPAAQFAALYGSARYAYLQSRRVEAVALLQKAMKMKSQFSDEPSMLGYVAKARRQIAKMENTLTGGGEAGMVGVDAKYEDDLDALRPALEAMPYFGALDEGEHTSHKEPDRIVCNFKFEVPAGKSGEDVKAECVAELQAAGLDFQMSEENLKECASCGRASMVEERCRRKRFGGLVPCACETVLYCNETCQRAHWKEHKQTCSARTADKCKAAEDQSGSTSCL